jgi:hypothetical protein
MSAAVEFKSVRTNTMSDFKQMDTWLHELLAFVTTNPPKEELDKGKKDMQDEFLKSYRNGQAAAGKKAHASEHEASHEGDSGDAPAASGAGERRRPHRPR